jgi:hypothetical protein
LQRDDKVDAALAHNKYEFVTTLLDSGRVAAVVVEGDDV